MKCHGIKRTCPNPKKEVLLLTGNIWRQISIVELAIIAIVVLGMLLDATPPRYVQVNATPILAEHERISAISQLDDARINANYIPDAKTAKAIGTQILKHLLPDEGVFSVSSNVEYDPQLRLWLVHGSRGTCLEIFVVLEQDTGKVRMVAIR